MKNKLTICIISDTHTKHKHLRNLPKADVIVHCGDISSQGYEHEIKQFLSWYSKLDQYEYKLHIAGNHDFLYEKNSSLAKSFIPENVIYLEDSGIEIEGYNFYGTPVQLPFNNWAFNREEHKLEEHWKAIPNNTDFLITHSPPYLIGDYVPYNKTHIGSPSLYKEIVNRIKPIGSFSGHNHSGRGVNVLDKTTFINATNLNEDYYVVYDPFLVEVEDNKLKLINYEQ